MVQGEDAIKLLRFGTVPALTDDSAKVSGGIEHDVACKCRKNQASSSSNASGRTQPKRV
jgi:hypothetical protein